MRKFMLKWLMLTVFTAFIFLPLGGQASSSDYAEDTALLFQPTLRVGILTNQQTVTVSADNDFDIVSTGNNKVLASFRARQLAMVTVFNGGFTINGQPVAANKIEIIQKKDDKFYYLEQFIQVNKRRYRGDISIHHTAGKSGMTIVNTLPIEEYLYGVIKNEISPEWALEAVKAQAVAARNYALTNYNKHKTDGFDVCATTDCQVYGGRESEAPRALEAVDATRGLIMLSEGKPISAFFHSSSGGYTENSENVWSVPQSYLKGVADFDQNCPYFRWEKRFTIVELNSILEKAGFNIGKLQSIELSPLGEPPVTSPDRGVSGRVKSVNLFGERGNVQVSGARLRTLLGLHSTLFDIKTDSHKELATPVSSTIKKQAVKDNPNLRVVNGNSIDTIVITGSGWGHGLGLSQWGAKAMAEKAMTDNTEYFKDILKHYYKGVEIRKAYL